MLLKGQPVDWEHPKSLEEGVNFVHLLRALRLHLPFPKYLVATALPAGKWVLKHMDLPKVARQVDFINLMGYDFSGLWTDIVGHQAQLFTPEQPYCESAHLSCDAGVNYVL